MEEIIIQEVKALGGHVALILAISYILSKLLLNHHLGKELETHKSTLAIERAKFETELKHANSLEIAKLDAVLKQKLAAQELRDARIYSQREDVLGQLHKDVLRCAEMSMDVIRVKSEIPLKTALDEINAAIRSFRDREYYFNKDFCERFYNTLDALKAGLIEVEDTRGEKTDNWKADLESRKSATSNHAAAVRSIRTELVDEIRKLIGTYETSEKERA